LALSIAPATDSTAGSMSGADKTKLDGISTIVSSFNSRTGSVSPQAGDYSANQITGLSSASITMGGDCTGTTAGATVATVGGSTAANIHSAEQAANNATNADTVSTIVKRDSSGNFSCGTITANVTGTASGNLLPSNNLSDVASAATSLANLLPSPVAINSNGEITCTHVLGSGTPTVAIGSAAQGTGGSPAISISGTDRSMQVSVTTGTGLSGTNFFTVTFHTPFASPPFPVFTPANIIASEYYGYGPTHNEPYMTATTTTLSLIIGNSTVVGNTTYIYNIHT